MFKLLKTQGNARRGEFTCAHGTVQTPVFMNVGTQGAIKDTEGLGYQRLSKFAKRLQELLHEYYEDPDVGEDHLHRRLEQLGFKIVNGRMFAVEDAEGNIVPTKMLGSKPDDVQ